MSVAAEQLQGALELVRENIDTPRRGIAVAHLRDVVDAVKRQGRPRQEERIMSDIERVVWAAVFAAHWTARREAQRKYGGEACAAAIAAAAHNEATSAVQAMREVVDEQALEAV